MTEQRNSRMGLDPIAVAGRAILDTATLFPFTQRDTLLRCATQRLFEPLWTEHILSELKSALLGHGATTEELASRLIGRIKNEFRDAMLAEYEHYLPLMTNHPKDHHVLAAAVAGRPCRIVTPNLRHFPPSALEPFGLVALNPDAFLGELLDINPGAVMDVLETQAGLYRRPPATLDQLLDRLSRQTPHFVRRVREAAIK